LWYLKHAQQIRFGYDSRNFALLCHQHRRVRLQQAGNQGQRCVFADLGEGFVRMISSVGQSGESCVKTFSRKGIWWRMVFSEMLADDCLPIEDGDLSPL
jgi:hypothetical protein